MSTDEFVALLWLAGLAIGWLISMAWTAMQRRIAEAAFAAARAERAQADAARADAAAWWDKINHRCGEWREAMALAEYGACKEALEIAAGWSDEDARGDAER